jgi:gliding motility-associated-like protein
MFFVIVFTAFQIRVVALSVDFNFDKVCLGDATTLISLAIPSFNDSIRYQWWDLNGDGRFNDATGDTVTYLFLVPGFKNVGLKVMTWGGEVKALYKLVPVGQVDAGFIAGLGCTGQRVPFYDQSILYSDTVTSYQWDFGDGTAWSYEKNPTHSYTLPGNYNILLSVVTRLGCTDSASQTISIGEAPVLNLQFYGDTVFYAGDSVIVSTVESFDSIFWSTGERTGSIIIYNGGQFWVKGYLGGCYNEKYFTTRIKEFEKNPVIMTLFTPNGDGKNDLWEILNLSVVQPCEVNVYNRFGERILSDPEYRNDWDGSFRGNQLPNDTYYFFVRCFDNVLYKGTVNILK